MSTAGPNAPGTMADDSSYGTRIWSSVDSAKVSDDARATASKPTAGTSTSSHYLKATNFGFSIPSGATIDGVSVSIERSASNNSSPKRVSDDVVKLVKGGAVSGANKAAAGNWVTTDSAVSYGGAADLWSLSLTDTDVNASDFGVVLSCLFIYSSGKGQLSARVDYISITIYYTTGGGGLSRAVASQSYRQRRV